jgi:aconitate hydratase 2/2-methylisocitrate dehydratase
MGKLPTPTEYMEYAGKIDSMAPEIYRYLNFDQMPDFVESAKRGQEVVLKLAM